MREVFLGALFAAAILLAGWSIGRQEVRSLEAQVKAQNHAASEKLGKLTRERDEKQAMLNQQAEQQEKEDAEREEEIERLTYELATRPVRVRIVTQAGACGGGAPNDGAGAADPGAESEAPAYGLLPESNSRRLADALSEVETLSAAYNSCRARLLRNHKEADASGGT